jgi:DNA-binding MarR family transcriptional regulator
MGDAGCSLFLLLRSGEMVGDSDNGGKRRELRRLTQMLESLRLIDEDMTMQQASVLVAILELGMDTPPTVKDVRVRVGLSQSTVSRCLRVLAASALYYAKDGTKRRGGLGLVTMESDLEDMRYKRIKLTPKGELALSALTRGGENADKEARKQVSSGREIERTKGAPVC